MPATIFSGSNIKGLKDNYVFGTGSDATSILSGTDDPRSVAQSANKGSLYLRKGTDGGQVFRKIDDGSTTNWVIVGSLGQNYVTNPDADAGVTDWSTYADAAGTTPVDGTGGAATVALTQTIVAAEVLRGTGGFKLAKDAADRQGEGVSIELDTFDNADKNSIISISFEYDATDTSYADGDLAVFIYDKDNSQLITVDPDANIEPNKGRFQGTFASTDADDYRLIIHVTSTNASAYDFFFDDVIVNAQQLNFGPAMTDSIDRSSDFTISAGFGTVTDTLITVRRVGDKAIVQGRFETGTVAASIAEITLPSDLVIDSAKLSSQSESQYLGMFISHFTSAGAPIFNNSGGILFYDGSTTNKVFPTATMGTGGFVKRNGNADWQSTKMVSFVFEIPILGWNTNVVNSESKSFQISNFLANGTRVTVPPTALGEYRSRIGASSSASIDAATDDAPTAAPNVADGMRIFAKNFASAGTAGQSNVWDIFIGKNKVFQMFFYNTTGKTGILTTDLVKDSGSNSGTRWHYDESSGILTVAALNAGTTATVGENNAGSNIANGYFDVRVADNSIFVQSDALTSSIHLDTGNGFGSTNTEIRRYTTISKQTGNDMTLTQSATLGDSITINKDGRYAMTVSNQHNVGQAFTGISLNSTTLATSIAGITVSDRLAIQSGNGTNGVDFSNASWAGNLSAGDIIRCHVGLPGNLIDSGAILRISRIG